MKENIQAVFKRVIPFSNFVTPDVLTYEGSKTIICEFSKGIGMEGEFLYGVTTIIKNDEGGWELSKERSKLCFGYAEARRYIKVLIPKKKKKL